MDIVIKEERELPKDWKWVKLIEACEKIVDGSHNPPRAKDSGMPMLSAKDILNNKIYFDKPRWVSEQEFLRENKRTNIHAGDILLTIVATIGRTAVVPIKAPMFTLQRSVAVLKTIQNPYFICYAFQTPKFQQQLRDYAKGTAQKGVYLKTLSQLEIPLPPRLTQQSIVSKIEELFSELDKGIENLHTAQQQLETYRQSVLKWAFEGKLTNENLKEGELPKGWKMVKTIDVIEIINNGYTPTSQYLLQGSGEVPFIKVYNLNFDGSLNFKKNPTFIPLANHKKDLKRSICLPGDVLINIVGPPLGKVSVVTNQYPEWNINQAIVMLRPNEKVLSKYISYFMQNSVTINWLENTSKATAGQWNVKVSTCREIPFPFCSVKDQNKIIQEIESRLSVADKMEESITQSLQQAEALRQSILKKAFEGRLV